MNRTINTIKTIATIKTKMRELKDAKEKRGNAAAYSWFSWARPHCFVMVCVGLLRKRAHARRVIRFVPR
jgi:hypothetical protein